MKTFGNTFGSSLTQQGQIESIPSNAMLTDDAFVMLTNDDFQMVEEDE